MLYVASFCFLIWTFNFSKHLRELGSGEKRCLECTSHANHFIFSYLPHGVCCLKFLLALPLFIFVSKFFLHVYLITESMQVVANILSKGTKLREYTKGVENNIRQVELDSIQVWRLRLLLFSLIVWFLHCINQYLLVLKLLQCYRII